MTIRERLERLHRSHNTIIVFWYPWYWRQGEAARLRKWVSHLEWISRRSLLAKVRFICKAILWPLIAGLALIFAWRRYAKESVLIDDRSMGRQFWELCVFTFWYGGSPTEYYNRGMFNEDFPSVLRDFISGHECVVLANALNGEGEAGIKNKGQFESICVTAGVPVVPVLCSFEPGKGGAFSADFEIPRVDLFLKPAHRDRGVGIERWDFDESSDSWSFNGRVLPAGGLRAHLKEVAVTDAYILQQAVSNHSSVACFSLSGAVTFRVVTVCDGLSEPEVIAAYLAAPRGYTVTNHEGNGGMVAELDISTQRFGAAFSDTPYVEKHRNHPDTGAQIEGVEFADWPELAALAVRTHALFSDVFSVGWDVVYTPEGFRLLEGNTLWGMSPGLFLGRTCYVRKCLRLLSLRGGSKCRTNSQ
tara:strand:+ start:1224 stop:2474 length:1251 start_codon:yes stop_codon:yes gene_type:complete